MLVREVGELLRSIDSPSISNPNENRSESLPACSRSLLVLAYVMVAFLHACARQNASLVLDEARPIHTIGEGKTPITPGQV
jgi:hypothetical protein